MKTAACILARVAASWSRFRRSSAAARSVARYALRYLSPGMTSERVLRPHPRASRQYLLQTWNWNGRTKWAIRGDSVNGQELARAAPLALCNLV